MTCHQKHEKHEQYNELNNYYNEYHDNFKEFENYVINKYDHVFVTIITIPWNSILFQRPQQMAKSFSKLNWLSIYLTNYEEDKMENNAYRKIDDNLWLSNDINNLLKIKRAYYSFYSTVYFIDIYEIYSIINKNGGFFIYEYIDQIDPKISNCQNNCDILNNYKSFAFDYAADLLIASADKLHNEVIKYNKPTLLLNNGVDVEHFTIKKHEQYVFSENIINFRKKHKYICGYYGAIAPWLDYEVINDIVTKRSDLGFIFIGCDYQDCLKKLPKNNNFLYVNSINYNVLPYYGFLFDICIIPFENGEIARTTSPLKLYEYFSLEKPVITSSSMLECIKYNEVLHYNNIFELNNVIDKAILLKDDVNYKKKILKNAYENDWRCIAKKYAETLLTLKYKFNKKKYFIIIVNNNINLFNCPKEKSEFIYKWGLNVCAITFNNNEKYKTKIKSKKKYTKIQLHAFAEIEELFDININHKKHTVKILNNIQMFEFNINVHNKDVIEIQCNKKNVVYISKLLLLP